MDARTAISGTIILIAAMLALAWIGEKKERRRKERLEKLNEEERSAFLSHIPPSAHIIDEFGVWVNENDALCIYSNETEGFAIPICDISQFRKGRGKYGDCVELLFSYKEKEHTLIFWPEIFGFFQQIFPTKEDVIVEEVRRRKLIEQQMGNS